MFYLSSPLSMFYFFIFLRGWGKRENGLVFISSLITFRMFTFFKKKEMHGCFAYCDFFFLYCGKENMSGRVRRGKRFIDSFDAKGRSHCY